MEKFIGSVANLERNMFKDLGSSKEKMGVQDVWFDTKELVEEFIL